MIFDDEKGRKEGKRNRSAIERRSGRRNKNAEFYHGKNWIGATQSPDCRPAEKNCVALDYLDLEFRLLLAPMDDLEV